MSGGSLLRFVTLSMVWGSSFLFIKVAVDGLSPFQVVLGRLSLGSAVLLGILFARRQRLPRDIGVWGHLALMGLVANIVPFTLFAWGEERITSGLAGVLNGATPLFTLAIAVLALPEERWNPTRGTGLALGFVGVLLVVGPWDQNPLTSSIPGQLACVAAAASYGVAFVYTRRFLSGRGYPPLVLAAGQLTAAAALLALAFPLWAHDPVSLRFSVVASVTALGAVGTGLAYLLYYRLIQDESATTTSMVTYLIPVVSVVLGILALGEPVTWNLFVGGAVVICGVAIAEGRFGRLRHEPPHASVQRRSA